MDVIHSFISLIPIGLTQGLIFAMVAMAIMIPFRILSLPDISAEGTFGFGGCVTAQCLVLGFEPVLAVCAGALAGFLGGLATALIHVKVKLDSLLCGVLLISILYTLDIRVMGHPNTALFNYPNLFAYLPVDSTLNRILLLIAVNVVLVCAILWFLNTQHGLAMRAIGSSQAMARAQGIHVTIYILAGFGLANCIAALGGGFQAQNQGFADVNMGLGALVNGLAAVLLGEALVGNRTLKRLLVSPVVGSVVYFQLVSAALALGFQPADLKLVTALFVVATFLIMRRKKHNRGTAAKRTV